MKMMKRNVFIFVAQKYVRRLEYMDRVQDSRHVILSSNDKIG